MGKGINVSGDDGHGTFELAQSGSTDADTAKISWHSPKLRVLQISQETSTPATSGAVG